MRPLRATDLAATPLAEDHEATRLGWFARQQVRLIGLVRGARSEEQSIGNGERRAEATARRLEPELETLNRLGLALAGQLDMDRLVKAVTDAGVAITGAAFGAFLYRDASGGATHYVSGAPPEAFVDFPLFQDAERLRIAVPRCRLSQRRPRLRPALWPEPAVQADAARPVGPHGAISRRRCARGAGELLGGPLLRTSRSRVLPRA